MIRIEENIPDAEEYNLLRQLVGWGTLEHNMVNKKLPNSLYGVCAYADNEIIGMGRVVGDGGIAFYIQDIIIIPAYQRQGIGTMLMRKIMEYVSKHATNNSFVGLISAKEKEPFYERYGFIRRPNDKFGSGMTIFWKVEKTG
jgi:ribosomal protein S18 acetylase RimI-like enzyme